MPDKGLLPADLPPPRYPWRLIAETYVPHWARIFYAQTAQRWPAKTRGATTHL